MKQTDENTAMMFRKVTTALGSLPGYPRDMPESMPFYAKQVLRIVYGEPLQKVWEREWRASQGSKKPCPACTYGPPDMMDYDWLIEQAVATCQRFPTITQLREIYASRFTAAEGHKVWAQTYDLLYNKG